MVTVIPSPLHELRERILRIEGTAARSRSVLPFGIAEIDRHLPGGGLALGSLHEVAGGGNGAIDGAAAALFAAGIAARTSGWVLWCVIRQDLFAPAITAYAAVADTWGAAHGLTRYAARPMMVVPVGESAKRVLDLPIASLRLPAAW